MRQPVALYNLHESALETMQSLCVTVGVSSVGGCDVGTETCRGGNTQFSTTRLGLLVFVAAALSSACGGSDSVTSTNSSALSGSATPEPQEPQEPAINTEPVVPRDFVGTVRDSIHLTDADRAALEKASQLHRKRNPRGEDRTRRGFGQGDGK